MNLFSYILIFLSSYFHLYFSLKDCGYILDGVDDSISFTVSNNFNPRFTLMFWFKNSWKERNGHIPQTIFAQGKNSADFTPHIYHDHNLRVIWNSDSKLLIEIKSYDILCSFDMIFQYERYYHFAMLGGHNSTMKIFINGIDINPICFKNKGSPSESRVVVGQHTRIKILNGVPIYLGSSLPVWGNADDNYFKGSITDFRVYTKLLTPAQIYAAMFLSSDSQDQDSPHKFLFLDQELKFNCNHENENVFKQTTTSNNQKEIINKQLRKFRTSLHKTVPPPDKTSSAMVHLAGSPTIGTLNHGDSYISVMLSVIEAKLSIFSLINEEDNLGDLTEYFLKIFGPISSIVNNNENSLKSIQHSLQRHFDVLLDEAHLWRSYNEYAIRLEMLGHTIALLLKQKNIIHSPIDVSSINTNNNNDNDNSHNYLHNNNNNKDHKNIHNHDYLINHGDTNYVNHSPSSKVIAIIAPATSKGIPIDQLDRLAIVKSLISSLYKTRSSDYIYRVYLSVNENDPIYSNDLITNAIFDSVYVIEKESYLEKIAKLPPSQRLPGDSYFPRISHKVIVVPSSMIPKRSLSGLFNIPTLVAYEDGCDYFYIVNDDLLFKSQGWTESLIDPLLNNPVYPGLGVSGGVDVSDSETPQIEFPFFSRVHVELFPWCGTNPWIFKNWWEDNWLTDVYLPFNSIFYQKGVVVENYVGVETESNPQLVSGKTADPRYEVDDGRKTPPFYVAEVESARKRILDFLESKNKLQKCETRDFHNKNYITPNQYPNYQLVSNYPRNMSYCFEVQKRIPSLTSMPIHPHEDVLDPCNSGIAEGSTDKKYRIRTHAKEIPHVSYSSTLSCQILRNKKNSIDQNENIENENIIQNEHEIKSQRNELDYDDWRIAKYNDVNEACSRLYDPKLNVHDKLLVGTFDDLDNDSYRAWMDCTQKIGFAYKFKTKALIKGVLCLSSSIESDEKPFESCQSDKKLKILILHNHGPLFTRYGSDKRLYHIAETMVGLGHEVSFGGTFSSDLETDDDHSRLRNIGAKLYSPLATMLPNQTVIPNAKEYQKLLKVLRPDFVLMTLWFWNIPPTIQIFYDLTRSTLPNVSIGILSDDAHTFREMKRNKSALPPKKPSKILNKEASKFLHQQRNKTAFLDPKVISIYYQEINAYEKADVILTITEDDKEKILMTIDQEFDSLMRLAHNLSVEYTQITNMSSKFQVVRYALSPTEIISDRGMKLRYEGGGVMDGSKRSQLSFVGNGANPTNKEALEWFLGKVFHLIKEKHHDMMLIIIGADWEYLKELFPQHKESLIIRGLLSQEDMTAALLTSKVFISPIVASTGLNTKNLLALSRGLPMVTTPDGSHGLMYSFETSKDLYPPFYVVNSEIEFSNKVLELYNNNELWQEVALAALRHARKSFSLNAQAREIDRAFQIAFHNQKKD